jgi:LTXXQ motif family protein
MRKYNIQKLSYGHGLFWILKFITAFAALTVTLMSATQVAAEEGRIHIAFLKAGYGSGSGYLFYQGHQVGFLKRQIKPTGPQMELLNKLQAASAAAKSAITSSCGNEKIETGPVHLAAMEATVDCTAQLSQNPKEPYEAFYASLDDHQKILLDSLGPGRRGWRW